MLTSPDLRQVQLGLGTAMLHRGQELRIDSCQPGQRSRIQAIIFSSGLDDQAHLLGVRHRHLGLTKARKGQCAIARPAYYGCLALWKDADADNLS